MPLRSPATGRRLSDRNVYGVAELEAFEPVFGDMARVFEAQGIPADTSIDALDAFEGTDFIGEVFGEPFRKVFAASKRQEK